MSVVEHPANGAKGVPRDAVIRLAGPLVDVPLGVQFEVHEDGVYRTDIVEQTRRFGTYWVYEARAVSGPRRAAARRCAPAG